MERITRKHLDDKLVYLTRLGKSDISLDHHQPGGAKYTWAVENAKGTESYYLGRMTARECLLFLCGMIEGVHSKVKELRIADAMDGN